ncbi:MAG: serine/threonine-protein kinase [Gemmatimonadaceae bacterium]
MSTLGTQQGLSDAAVRRLRDAAEWPEPDPARYVIVELIGRGGMGAVYRARDLVLQRDVALKVLHIGAEGGDLATRLTREARTLAHLEHPGIVPVHDVGTLADGRPFYSMKLVHGKRLDDVAAGRSRAELLRLFTRICEPIAFAHSRAAVHRDVKPENVMVGEFGEVLVLDWGISKLMTDSAAMFTKAEAPAAADDTGAGAVLGTHGYMAPEQARGDSATVDQRADVFSLGKLLAYLVSLSDARKMPRSLAAIVRKATASEPAQRYDDASRLARDVLRFLAAERVDAYRENLWEQALRLYRRHRPLVLLILVYLIVRLLLIFWRTRTT